MKSHISLSLCVLFAICGLSYVLSSPTPQRLIYGGGRGALQSRAIEPLRPYDPPRTASRYPNCGNNPASYDQTCCVEGRKRIEQNLNNARARGLRVEEEVYYHWDFQSARCSVTTRANSALFAYNFDVACEQQVDIRHCCNYSKCSWTNGYCVNGQPGFSGSCL